MTGVATEISSEISRVIRAAQHVQECKYDLARAEVALSEARERLNTEILKRQRESDDD